ncbi:hypothetical protein [Formosa sp. S-31]|uniref:hypothetical protein n=1 Tax=Formosa sp. S-31 TaxID=2790949 RepID=UPI003EB93263
MKTSFFTFVFIIFVGHPFFSQTVDRTISSPMLETNSSAGFAQMPGFNVQAGLNIGASVSFPVNGANEVTSVGVLGDLTYIFQASRTIGVGLATGYGIYFGKDTSNFWGPIHDGSDFRYLPVAFATRYGLTAQIVVGGDIGYAIGLSDNWDGGFYYRPMFGYNVSEMLQLNISYSGITDYWTWSAINLGCTINIH